MGWKKFKEEKLTERYTIMLLPHSKRKPIHFKIPAWGFGLIFCALSCFILATIYFACSAVDVNRVSEKVAQLEIEKQQVEMEKQRAESEKTQIIQENIVLRNSTEEQKAKLKDLEGKTDEAIKELEKLYSRENEIREQAGLGVLEVNEKPEAEQTAAEDFSTERQADEGIVRTGAEGKPVAVSFQNTVLSTKMPTPLIHAWKAEQPKLSREVHKVELRLNAFQNEALIQNQHYDKLSKELSAAAEKAKLESSLGLRQRVANYALQFVGNAYVWGGNDPHTGVDCSGFTKYVLSKIADVELPRTAATQIGVGKTVGIDEARPGDLVFYYGDGYINHVAMYIGDGKVVHAASRKSGIKVSSWNYRKPVRIKNVIGS